MKRYPPYDPPEYTEWQPDTAVVDEYLSLARSERVKKSLEILGSAGLERLYRDLVKTRLYDITLKRWVRTGVLTKAWLGLGEEAVTVGGLHAVADDDPVGPMIRNQAAAFLKGISLQHCFEVYLATGATITKGRDLHIGDLEKHCVSPISHVGDLVPVLAGFALGFKTRGEKRVALTYTGEGATRTGTVHEGLALAADLALPLICVIQDNHVALGTRRSERFQTALRSTAAGHGVTGMECDGNHVLDVHATIREARDHCLEGKGPVIVYARTFRMGGHATHDEREARDLFEADEFSYWGRRDPVACYEHFLTTHRGVQAEELQAWEAEVTEEIEAAAERAKGSSERAIPDPSEMLGDVFAGGA